MKIAGIAGKKHPTLKKGEPIALSPEEKVKLMAKEALTSQSPEGYLYVPLTATLIGTVSIIKGRRGVKNEDPTQYTGVCNVKYRITKLSTDKVFPVRDQKVKVHIKDSKNEIGVDDLEIVDSSML